MSITATVCNGTVSLPPDLNLPDGTEVEIVIHANCQNGTTPGANPVCLPTFNGGGLQRGVNLNDSRATRELLDEPDKFSQLC